ncbi:type II toxin-antitoxin system RelE/ParE family toxin [bacterium]|nr:type II toxin-antitoxin system RelE/ParE family toxin [bacterium]MBU1985020.1 type II toxin-antitoxin system RelE/ParE family toxin [bacterium]
MEISFTKSFLRDYEDLPPNLKDRVKKAILKLASDIEHPSLRVHKMKGRSNVWEARVTDGYRMTFSREEGTLIMRRVGPHDILKKI